MQHHELVLCCAECVVWCTSVHRSNITCHAPLLRTPIPDERRLLADRRARVTVWRTSVLIICKDTPDKPSSDFSKLVNLTACTTCKATKTNITDTSTFTHSWKTPDHLQMKLMKKTARKQSLLSHWTTDCIAVKHTSNLHGISSCVQHRAKHLKFNILKVQN